MPYPDKRQEDANLIMPKPGTRVRTLYRQQDNASDRGYQKDEQQAHRYTALLAKTFGYQALVPSPMGLNVQYSGDDERKTGQRMENRPVVPHLVGGKMPRHV